MSSLHDVCNHASDSNSEIMLIDEDGTESFYCVVNGEFLGKLIKDAFDRFPNTKANDANRVVWIEEKMRDHIESGAWMFHV